MAIKDGWEQIRDIFADKGVHLSPLEAKVLDSLLGCERIVPKDHIIDHVYHDAEDGGPLDAKKILHVIIWKLRKTLPVSGIPWRLVTHITRGYQLTYDNHHLDEPGA